MTYDEAYKVLKENNQEHVLKFYNELSDKDKANILSQISKIDFRLVKSLYNNKDNVEMTEKEVTPIEVTDKEKIDKEKYQKIGEKVIKNGELAVCSMAGGQGTRLGFNGPKGTYMLDLEKPTSIFETIINKLKKENEKYGIYLYWYVMTSNQNNEDTINFFKNNNYFDYDKEHIIFFVQGELPLLDTNGNIVLKDKANIFMAPDGNGGIFRALGNDNIIEHMKNHGIKYLAIGNVDNILINFVDPIMIGLMIDEKKDVASKSFMKPSPEGKWGVFCKMNGIPRVIEYIETPKELLEARNDDGELIYGDAHFGLNVFDVDFLSKIVFERMPFHVAFKKNNILNMSGEFVSSDTYKFEAFIFESFKMANNVLIYRVKKNEEFAPIKNREGEESPETAIKLYKEFYKI